MQSNEIEIRDTQNSDSVVLKGTIEGGKILNDSGMESDFIYKNPNLYHKNDEDKWYEFTEFKDNN